MVRLMIAYSESSSGPGKSVFLKQQVLSEQSLNAQAQLEVRAAPEQDSAIEVEAETARTEPKGFFFCFVRVMEIKNAKDFF